MTEMLDPFEIVVEDDNDQWALPLSNACPIDDTACEACQ